MVADGSVDIAAIWGEGIPTSNSFRMNLGQLSEMAAIKAHFPAVEEEQEKLEEIKLSLSDAAEKTWFATAKRKISRSAFNLQLLSTS